MKLAKGNPVDCNPRSELDHTSGICNIVTVTFTHFRQINSGTGDSQQEALPWGEKAYTSLNTEGGTQVGAVVGEVKWVILRFYMGGMGP